MKQIKFKTTWSCSSENFGIYFKNMIINVKKIKLSLKTFIFFEGLSFLLDFF